jgi:hypothetical protein
MSWQQKPPGEEQRYSYWERGDGALVKRWAPAWKEGARPWVAYPPGAGQFGYWSYRHRWQSRPRVWKTAEAAMKAVDKVYPERVGMVNLNCPECRLEFNVYFDSQDRVSDLEQECHCVLMVEQVEDLVETARFEWEQRAETARGNEG